MGASGVKIDESREKTLKPLPFPRERLLRQYDDELTEICTNLTKGTYRLDFIGALNNS